MGPNIDGNVTALFASPSSTYNRQVLEAALALPSVHGATIYTTKQPIGLASDCEMGSKDKGCIVREVFGHWNRTDAALAVDLTQHGMVKCSFCKPGMYSPNASSSTPCKNCPSGYYIQIQGQSSCSKCIPGRVQAVSGLQVTSYKKKKKKKKKKKEQTKQHINTESKTRAKVNLILLTSNIIFLTTKKSYLTQNQTYNHLQVVSNDWQHVKATKI